MFHQVLYWWWIFSCFVVVYFQLALCRLLFRDFLGKHGHGFLFREFWLNKCRRQRCFVPNVFRYLFGRDSSFQPFGWECFFQDSWVENLFGYFWVVISLEFFLKILSLQIFLICLNLNLSEKLRFRHLNLNLSEKFRFRHIYERNAFTSESESV